ncbi:MAG: glycosyltransferase family 4 protein [Candidatus Eremiobacteraeota bacterium]|nr:glycosyltransferase family 4 protein [Candidatus Eremiobacteraeota bacterium]
MSHLLAVTSRYPFGHQESYLNTELQELKQYFGQITIVPVRAPDGIRRHAVPEGINVLEWPLFDTEVAVRASAALVLRPIGCCSALAQLFASHDPGKTKNAAIVAKGLALGQWACEHRVTHVHAYWMSTPASVAFIAGSVAELPWSATAHRWDIYEKNAFDVKARAATFVRTISDRATRDLRARIPSLGSRIVEIRLGARVPTLPTTGWRSSRVVLRIVCPAALVPVKGHDDVLQAITLLRSRGITVHCIFAGSGPLRPMLEARARKLGLGGVVQFAGHVPQRVLHRWYRSGTVDAVVLASRADGEMMMEGLPSALIDAMAYGVPAVVTDSGSICELMDDSCGYLVRSNSPEAIAVALARVHMDPRTAYQRATRAYYRVKALHDVHTQMRKLASAFLVSGGAG